MNLKVRDNEKKIDSCRLSQSYLSITTQQKSSKKRSINKPSNLAALLTKKYLVHVSSFEM